MKKFLAGCIASAMMLAAATRAHAAQVPVQHVEQQACSAVYESAGDTAHQAYWVVPDAEKTAVFTQNEAMRRAGEFVRLQYRTVADTYCAPARITKVQAYTQALRVRVAALRMKSLNQEIADLDAQLEAALSEPKSTSTQ